MRFLDEQELAVQAGQGISLKRFNFVTRGDEDFSVWDGPWLSHSRELPSSELSPPLRMKAIIRSAPTNEGSLVFGTRLAGSGLRGRLFGVMLFES
jgi:hypothetical protein